MNGQSGSSYAELGARRLLVGGCQPVGGLREHGSESTIHVFQKPSSHEVHDGRHEPNFYLVADDMVMRNTFSASVYWVVKFHGKLTHASRCRPAS